LADFFAARLYDQKAKRTLRRAAEFVAGRALEFLHFAAGLQRWAGGFACHPALDQGQCSAEQTNPAETVGAEIVEAPLVGADQDGVRDPLGNPLVFES